MLRLLLTGGGTAGHVVPQMALIQHIQTTHPEAVLCYVGSQYGIEKQLINTLNIPYYSIVTGKWRRYLSWRNLLIPFQIIIGLGQSIRICLHFKPTIVFSKGGFVALPIVFAAWVLRIPLVVHESDVVPGLANRVSFPLASQICYSFKIPSKTRYLHKTAITGLPIRKELTQGDPQKGLEFLKFNNKKPILLVWGGSLGAVTINDSVKRLLPCLRQQFQIVHLCGPQKLPMVTNDMGGYRTIEYLETLPLSHVLACADLVISRAGATAIYELLVLHKPHILCPLSTQASRGEQIHNAQYLDSLGLSTVVYPKDFNDVYLLETVHNCYRQLAQWKNKIALFNLKSGTHKVYESLCTVTRSTQ